MDVPSGLKPPKETIDSVTTASRLRAVSWNFLYTAPWWLIALVLLGIEVVFLIASNEQYSRAFSRLKDGITMTLTVSFIAYTSALVIGMLVGLIRSNPPAPPKPGSRWTGAVAALLRTLLYNVATFYVQILRGLPILVVLLIVAFILVPIIEDLINSTFGLNLQIRGTSPESAIIALAFVYGAFLSETFRAGIQSIGRGQIEAARSLGMNYFLTMRLVVLPQALRRILPPLGNDLVAMIKDSSLVAILGVQDITQLAKTYSGSSFRYVETYMVVAVIYLTMTVIGSMLVRFIERRTRFET